MCVKLDPRNALDLLLLVLTAVVDEEVDYLEPHEDVVREPRDVAVTDFKVTNLREILH